MTQDTALYWKHELLAWLQEREPLREMEVKE